MRSKHTQRTQRGLGMIDVLVAMVVFALGMSGLAYAYLRVAPAPLQNASAAQTQMASMALFAQVSAQPWILPVNVQGVSTASGLPTALQPWFSQEAALLPGLTVSIASGPDASGNACSSKSCGLTVTLAWTQLGMQRAQVFYGQVGIE